MLLPAKLTCILAVLLCSMHIERIDAFSLKFDLQRRGKDTIKPSRADTPSVLLLKMSGDVPEDKGEIILESKEGENITSPVQFKLPTFLQNLAKSGNRPPPQVEDSSLLLYDVFLLINLTLSVSFWSAHRLSFEYIGSAFSEGCLLCIMWIGAGLYSGAFLLSAVDGHYGAIDERGGPKAAGRLGFHTFLNTVNFRLVFALASAVLDHRPVGSAPGEELLLLESLFGFLLMPSWRALHSSYTLRL